jgi:hypothetical protein
LQIGNQILTFNHVEHLLDNEQKELFFSILADPEKAGTVAIGKLEMLVKAYPQVSILHAMLARAYKAHEHSDFEQKLRSASARAADRGALYKLINHPDRLMPVDNKQIYQGVALIEEEQPAVPEPLPIPVNADIDDDDIRAPWDYPEEEEEEEQLAVVAVGSNDEVDEAVPVNTDIEEDGEDEVTAPVDIDFEEDEEQEVAALVNVDEETAPVNTDSEEDEELADAEPLSVDILDQDMSLPEPEGDEADEFDEDKYFEVLAAQMPASHQVSSYLTNDDEDDYNSAIEEETAPTFDESAIIAAASRMEDAELEIDDEVFDEITGIEDIKIEASPFTFIVEDGMIPHDTDEDADDEEEDTGLVLHEAVIDEDEVPDEPETPHHKHYYEEPRQAIDDEADRLILGNIAGADYFAFNDKFPGAAESEAEEEVKPQPVAVTPRLENKFINDDGRVSKYHDDKMPYSFMWWLDKTRREHAGTYQPYTPYRNVTAKAMHTEAPAELQRQYYENIFHLTTIENLDKAKAEFTSGNHEDEIIERFIKEEPQIKPPSNDKLDNENKARKSAEDQNELVSETLARIYMDQMLYHKAITTYKKLLLKFPEKSSYFVAQIELLERKIN